MAADARGLLTDMERQRARSGNVFAIGNEASRTDRTCLVVAGHATAPSLLGVLGDDEQIAAGPCGSRQSDLAAVHEELRWVMLS